MDSGVTFSLQFYPYVEPRWMSQVLAAVSPLVGLEEGKERTSVMMSLAFRAAINRVFAGKQEPAHT